MKQMMSGVNLKSYLPPCRGMERALVVVLAVVALAAAGAAAMRVEWLKDSRSVSSEDVQALSPRVAPPEDSAIDYAKARQSFSYVSDYDKLLSRGEVWILPLNDELRFSMAALLEPQSNVLSLLYEAATKPKYSAILPKTGYHLDALIYTMGYLNRVLLIKAYFEADHGDFDEAAKAVNASLAISRVLIGQPSDFPAQKERIMSDTAAALSEILGAGVISPADYSILQKTLSQFDSRNATNLLLSYEAFQQFSNDIRWPARRFDGAFTVNLIAEQWFGEGDMRRRLILWRTKNVKDLAREPLGKYLPRSAAMDWGIRNISVTLPATSKESRILSTQTRVAALAAVLRTALAVEQFRGAHGHVPDDLKQLVPEFLPSVPVDPFSNAAVLYRKDAEGYRVYSVGDNFRDDRGDVNPNGPFSRQDIGVRIRYPGPQGETSSQSTEDKT